MKSVVVIGGGASGLMCAISIKRKINNADVCILERLPRTGKKLMATGNGRCNITNVYCDASRYYGENTSIVTSTLDKFSVSDTIDFFKSIGILIKIEDEGKAYPYSDQASSVLDCLRFEAKRLNIKEVTDFSVTDIKKEANKYKIISQSTQIVADIVAVCAGGMSSASLGSNGSMFPVMEKLGHHITPLFPSLVQVKTDKTAVRPVKGMKFTGKASLYTNGKRSCTTDGEILFTEYGLSGPCIFNLSRQVAENNINNRKTEISLDLMPEYDYNTVLNLLKERVKNFPQKTLDEFLTGMINKRIGQTLIKQQGILPLGRECKTLNEKELKQLASAIKGYRFEVFGTMPFNNAQVCAGGIKTSEISEFFESKFNKNLFITGEILDIDGDCGGFNLQWAWSSGYVAACEISRRL